jgi:hypothetical protein
MCETVGEIAHGIPKGQEFVKDNKYEHQNPCGSKPVLKQLGRYELLTMKLRTFDYWR